MTTQYSGIRFPKSVVPELRDTRASKLLFAFEGQNKKCLVCGCKIKAYKYEPVGSIPMNAARIHKVENRWIAVCQHCLTTKVKPGAGQKPLSRTPVETLGIMQTKYEYFSNQLQSIVDRYEITNDDLQKLFKIKGTLVSLRKEMNKYESLLRKSNRRL